MSRIISWIIKKSGKLILYKTKYTAGILMKTNVTGINKASRKGLLGEIFSITITQISVIISTSNEERKKI